MIPAFSAETGNLPPGEHPATWEEIVERFGYTPWRSKLLDGLKAALESLRAAGCKKVYLDGSFVTAKERPGDFDACWVGKGVNGDLLDEELLVFDGGRATQKTKYGASYSLRSGQPMRPALPSQRFSSKTGMGIPKASSLLT